MEAQRLPYITIGIIALNVLLFVLTLMVAPKTQRDITKTGEVLFTFYLDHSYLDLPAETLAKFPPEVQQQIKTMKKIGFGETMETVNQQKSLTDTITDSLKEQPAQSDPENVDESQPRPNPSPIPEETQKSQQERLKEQRRQEQAQLNELVQAFEKAAQNDFYYKYGYVPVRGGVFTIFSSIFLHGGILHLAFNMLFLWLSGCNIEDLWGRVIYPIFYLAGGVIATLAHGLMFPASNLPLIGASGAIAAAMGAFMVRLYDTKIYFVYVLWLGMKPKIGRFSAPAYVMLPLWLLEQLWEAITSGSGSGVAFWAHIGGFIFGAVAAGLMKVTGVEEKYIAPALDKKTAVLDEHLTAGIAKLQEGDVDAALRELKEAAQHKPDDPIVHSELSHAYARKGKQDLALREVKRAVYIYLKQDRLEEAVNEYLESSAELPELMLDAPQQMKIAAALEQRAIANWQKILADNATLEQKAKTRLKSAEAQQAIAAAIAEGTALLTKAATAYRLLIAHYQNVAKTLDRPEAVNALTHYADLQLLYLNQPQEAQHAYQLALQAAQLAPEQKQELLAKAQQAAQRISAANAAEPRKQPETPAASQPQLAKKTAAPTGQPPKPNIPIQKKIKLAPEVQAPAKYQIGSVAPIEANKVLPLPDGLDLNRLSDPPLFFREIYVICVAQVTELTQRVKQEKKRGGKVEYVKYQEKHEVVAADIFLCGKSRPYRIATNNVAYPEFFPKPAQSMLENFRQFILYLIAQTDSVYLDQDTVNFLKTGKVRAYSEQAQIEAHEKIIWKQLIGATRVQCGQCWEVYWIDGAKIPPAGARTKCTKCGNALSVQKIKSDAGTPEPA